VKYLIRETRPEITKWGDWILLQYYTELANDYRLIMQDVVLHYPNPKISIRILLVYKCIPSRSLGVHSSLL
jgi:hypothetical protein